MSYSFGFRAINKQAAKVEAANRFAAIIEQQPAHAKDRDAVLANVGAAIDLLADDEHRDVSVSMNGYIAWPVGEVPENLGTVSIAAQACLVAREANATT